MSTSFSHYKNRVFLPFPWICRILAGVKLVTIFWWGGLDGVIRIISGHARHKIRVVRPLRFRRACQLVGHSKHYKIRGFGGFRGLIGPFFVLFVLRYGRFRTIFLHRMGNFEKFTDAPVFLGCDKFGRKCLFLLFVFGLACCLTSWWMMDGGEVVPEQQAGKKKKTHTHASWHQLMTAIIGIFLFVLC